MAVCFSVYGTDIRRNIFFTITPSWITYTATILITIHFATAYPLLLHVISQDVEGYLGIPDSKCIDTVGRNEKTTRFFAHIVMQVLTGSG